MKNQVTVMTMTGLLLLAGGCAVETHVGVGVAVDAPPPVVVYDTAVPPPVVIDEYYYVGDRYYYWHPDRHAYVVIGGFPPGGFRVERFDHLPRRDRGGHVAEHIRGTEFHPPAHGPARVEHDHSAPAHPAPPRQAAPPHVTQPKPQAKPQPKPGPAQHPQGHPQPHSDKGDKKADDNKPQH